MDLGALLAVYSVPRISQVHMWYRADLQLPDTAEAAAALASPQPTVLRAEDLACGADGEPTAVALAQCAATYGFAPGHETSAAGLFPLGALPWDRLAFSSGARALRFFVGQGASGGVDVGDIVTPARAPAQASP